MEHPAAHIQLPDRITVNDETELRLLQLSDAAALFQVVDSNRAHLSEWLPWVDTNREVAHSHSFVLQTRDQYLQKTGLTLGIFVRMTVAGILSLRSFDWPNRSAEIGYWLAKDFQGKGTMLRCCRTMISHAFTRLGLHRIVIRCASGNARSCTIPERLGFVREGLARDAEWLNGSFVDLNIYSLLSSDWKEK